MYFEELEIGQEASSTHEVSQALIDAFAEVSGDHNPVHVDPAYAASTRFGGVIAHGMLSAAYISAVLGNQLPGPGAVYLGQTLKFKGPVRPGDTVVASVRVKDLRKERAFVTMETRCLVAGAVVLEGEATLMVPRRPDSEAS